MGQKTSKIEIPNKCKCIINQSFPIKPYDYKSHIGQLFIYFPINKKDKGDIQFTWINDNNECIMDKCNCEGFNIISTSIKIENNSFNEYTFRTELQNTVKIRYGQSKSYILFIMKSN